jgi:hypothetical protein
MTEWFYVKNDLKSREDIKSIIMRPIWQRFGLRRPKVEMNEAAEECQRAFGIVCSFIGTRDLVQEHIAFRVWPLVEKWEMPKETIKETDEGALPESAPLPCVSDTRQRLFYTRQMLCRV